MELYKVGGCVRDDLLGVRSKDIDYSVVLSEQDLLDGPESDPFAIMERKLIQRGVKVYLTTPEYLTIRGKLLSTGEDVDFVLARKEADYSDGRRPDVVQVGTLEDDLARRDLSINAIAQDLDGNYIDPFEGQRDIKGGILRAVGNPWDRFSEDALRAVRAMRFSVTKKTISGHQFGLTSSLKAAMEDPRVTDAVRNKISDERIEGELKKMLKTDTMLTLYRFQQFPNLTAAMFAGRVRLDATMKG